MSDRVFGTAMLLLALGYGIVAWQLQAPFQYDPLGPETWPKILTVVLALCATYIVARPDPEPSWGARSTLGKLVVAVAAVTAYALAFEPFGFLVATSVFAFLLSWFCGATVGGAALYGIVLGGVGYVVATRLLELNLPRGIIDF